MARWENNARGRLEQAALALYVERGFEQTTVAEIAERAGLTERTFFRHFADKREVLFGGSGALQNLMVEAILSAPGAATPMQAVVAGLEAPGVWFQEDSARSRQRQAVIDANAELLARELSKLATLAGAMAGALRRRGVPEAQAGLLAEAGIVVFRAAFGRWIDETNRLAWAELTRVVMADLRAAVLSD